MKTFCGEQKCMVILFLLLIVVIFMVYESEVITVPAFAKKIIEKYNTDENIQEILTTTTTSTTKSKSTTQNTAAITTTSEATNNQNFFLQKTCHQPNLNPFDASIKNYITHPNKFLCKQIQPELTYIDVNGNIHVNISEKQKFENIHGVINCRWRTIEKENGSKDAIKDGSENMLNGTTENRFPKHDIIQTECFQDKTRVYYNLHTYPHLLKQNLQSPPTESELSVYLIVLESMSTSRFLRHMRSTKKYMSDNLGSFIFNGYNKVADNTFVNMMPILTGKRSGNQQYNMKDEFNGVHVYKDYFDDMKHLIWRGFAKKKYKTVFVENTPQMGLFEYHKHGFKNKKPFNFYYRPYFLRQKKLVRKSSNFCFGNKPKLLLQTKIAKQILMKYGHTQKLFLVDIYTEIGHEHENQIERGDSIFKEYLATLHRSEHLNKTVLFILGDHGARYGKIRNSEIGYFEERLPFLSITFPKWFLNKHKHISNALQQNTDRLLTPFDVHETILDLLNSNFKSKQRDFFVRQKSLLYNVPLNRTCKNAGIPDHYCSCYRTFPISVDSYIVKKAAIFLVNHINGLLSILKEKCAKLHLKEIKNASELSLNENVRNHITTRKYRVMIKTRPGNAIFEGLIIHTKDIFSIENDISRLTLYDKQSRCVKKMKKFCFFKI